MGERIDRFLESFAPLAGAYLGVAVPTETDEPAETETNDTQQ